MRKFVVAAVSLLLAGISFAGSENRLKAPLAKKNPKEVTMHGDRRIDDYGWLRDKSDPEVIAYLNAENAYADAFMKPTEDLQKKLYDEMLGRIKQTDVNVPYRMGDYLYYSRTEQGKQYPIYARRKGNVEAPEEILLDVNRLAEGKKFMSVAAFDVSDDGNLLAFSTDDNGYRQYKLQVKDLRSGEVLPWTAEKVGSVAWAADNRTLFYSVENDAKRQWRVLRHNITSKDPAAVVFDEADDLYDVDVERSRSGEWIFVTSESKTTSEVRMISAYSPASSPKVIEARKEDHKYYAEHRGDRLYLVTNDAGINFRVVSAPEHEPQQKNWVEVLPYRKAVRVEGVDAFANHLVVRERENGLSQLEVIDLRDGAAHRVSFPEPAYTVFPSSNVDFTTTKFRYAYQSLVTPSSIYDYDLETRDAKLLKRTDVLGGYDPANYVSERIFATASDGAKIPVALVYRKGLNPKAKNPLMLYAYGSYGFSAPDAFSSTRLSLLDRGMVFAIAHIRGGGEMGKEWHEQGRMMAKKNTFTDFIAAAEHLVKEKYTAKEKLAISGGSAGGLLMGAVANMRPDLFKVVVAYVPFVDVINTMLDASLPLTTQEYIEWGNPNDKDAYQYMKSYDPYSNVEKKKYPTMLVRTALNDSQVGYWEAAKWVAKLRTHKTDDNPLLLRVNMGAGHGGASGRYDKLKEDAHDYAFILTQLGLK